MNLTFLCLPVESCSILSKNVKSIYLSWSTRNTYATGVKCTHVHALYSIPPIIISMTHHKPYSMYPEIVGTYPYTCKKQGQIMVPGQLRPHVSNMQEQGILSE